MPQVVSIQYLRGFAALLVLVYHIGHVMPDTELRFALGIIGVDVFFVISGFIIWLTGRKLRPSTFLKRRLIRLVPLYWAITLLIVASTVVAGGQIDFGHLFQSLAFIAPAADAGQWPKPILNVGWTLNLEILFYALTALVLFAPMRARLPLLVCALGGLVAYGFLLPAGADARLGFYTSSFMGEFLIGVLLGALWTSGKFPTLSRSSILAVAFIGIGLSLLPLHAADRLVAYGGFVTLLVAVSLMAEPSLRARPMRPLVALGDASYALYLTHLPVIVWCASLIEHGWFADTVAVQLAGTFGLTLLAAFACHYGFERPIHRALTANRSSAAGRSDTAAA